MKALLLSLAFLSIAPFASAHGGHAGHLTFAGGALHAHASWETGPAVGTESILRLDWKNGADHSPAEPGTFQVLLWMPDMGHGSAPVTIDRVLAADGRAVTGSYRVSRMFFVMGGRWDVHVTVKLADGTEETRTLAVDLDDHGGGHDHGGHAHGGHH